MPKRPSIKHGKLEIFLKPVGANAYRFKDDASAVSIITGEDGNKISEFPFESVEAKTPTLFFNDRIIQMRSEGENIFTPLVPHLFDEAFTFRFEPEACVRKLDVPRNVQGKTAVVVPYFHFGRNAQMCENYQRFINRLNFKDVFVIECALPGDFEIPESLQFIRIEADSGNLMWQKERLINIAIKALPKEYTNVAWIDADVWFDDKDWHKELNEKLQDFAFVQLFDSAEHLDENDKPEFRFRSPFSSNRPELRPHPGFAWAARREIVEAAGGIFDYHVMGDGDSFIRQALNDIVHDDSTGHSQEILLALPGFQYKYLSYKNALQKLGGGSATCLSGNVKHLFHGPLSTRQYQTRQKILIRNGYDPVKDLIIDKSGLFRWVQSERTDTIKLEIGKYFNRATE